MVKILFEKWQGPHVRQKRAQSCPKKRRNYSRCKEIMKKHKNILEIWKNTILTSLWIAHQTPYLNRCRFKALKAQNCTEKMDRAIKSKRLKLWWSSNLCSTMSISGPSRSWNSFKFQAFINKKRRVLLE